MQPFFKKLLPTGFLGRTAYVCWGIALTVLKFNLDRLLSRLWLQETWSIVDYESAWGYVVNPLGQPNVEGWKVSMFAIGIPFIWAGMTLTVKRLRSAGLPLWLSLLFFVPVIKFLFFAVLAAVPSSHVDRVRPEQTPRSRVGHWLPRSRWGAAIAAAGITSVLAAAIVWMGTHVLQSYGWALFAGLPFCMGFVTSLIISFGDEVRWKDAMVGSVLACVFVGAILLAVALEGVVCILMAAPLALILTLMGSVFGCVVCMSVECQKERGRLMCGQLLLLPVLLGGEKLAAQKPDLIEVRTALEIDAPAEVVWRNVVTFSELPEPTELLFKLGIAFPVRAEIEGRGVGAVRYCQFSTGPFVEPITVWDEPRLLRFTVTSNPEPMQEWTPFHQIHPPHLHGFMESEQGQFLLERKATGGTILEGTTWYRHGLWPTRYWSIWSDRIIHTIHRRVLNHIRVLSEAEGTLPKENTKP
jgi:uncharacterized membrane protein YhaH (DUF805 family)